MTDLVRIIGNNSVGLPVTLADGTRFVVPAFVQITPTGALVAAGDTVGTELDTNGNIVPTYKAHAFTYDTSGNLVTDSVTDGANAWVRTFTYVQGAQTADSGWVKQ